MIRRVLAFLVVGLLVVPASAFAYLHYGFTFRGQSVVLKWEATPVEWYATSRPANGVTATQFQQALASAFDTWQSVPSASIGFRFSGFTNADPFEDDDRNVVGFIDPGDDPEFDRVLGATTFLIDVFTGEIVESDIFFNTQFDWSTSATGTPGRYDLASIATHEVGHLTGLAHSALGETELRPAGRRVLATSTVMFPIAFSTGNIADRVLQPDDIAGVSALYPDDGFSDRTGTITGRVQLGSRGLFGAHVVAYHMATGTMIGGFAMASDGRFEIAGLAPGPHILRVEPLDDGDVESFLSEDVDVQFLPRYGERIVVVAGGGETDAGIITVVAK